MSRSPDRVLLSRLVDPDYADPGRGRGQKYNYKSPILPELPRRVSCQTDAVRRIIDSILRSNGPGGGEVERHQLFRTERIDRCPDDCESSLRGPSTTSCHGAMLGEDIVEDDHDRQQFQDLLAAQVARSRWEIIGFVLMTNHFHLLVRTPLPNLAAGMQRLLSAHARRR